MHKICTRIPIRSLSKKHITNTFGLKGCFSINKNYISSLSSAYKQKYDKITYHQKNSPINKGQNSRFFTNQADHAPQETTSDGIEVPSDSIPWLRSNDPKRAEKRVVVVGVRPMFNFGFVIRLLKSMFRQLSFNEIISRTDSQYFPREFLNGCVFALKQFCGFVSKEDIRGLRSILTPEMLNIFEESIKKNQKNSINSKINIKVLDARVKDIGVRFGPKEAYDLSVPLLERASKYSIKMVFNYCISAEKTESNKGDGGGELVNPGALAILFSSDSIGYQVVIDVECDAEIEYSVFHKDDKIEKDVSNRSVIITMKSNYYTDPNDFFSGYAQLVEKSAPGYINKQLVPEEKVPVPFEWKISDIDYLLCSKENEELESIFPKDLLG
ncbi:hypothetical protein BB559_001734 [Furculomyces boomerangus]|uniref:Tim44-like domain-containing protein n=1 Tax=Furculomyces boomerangus TaxID=61424 RepID=A0A2T9Z0V9_9FUNG|nr:hypothetical protein BB559_001734 [Furculomyces boomerangus]